MKLHEWSMLAAAEHPLLVSYQPFNSQLQPHPLVSHTNIPSVTGNSPLHDTGNLRCGTANSRTQMWRRSTEAQLVSIFSAHSQSNQVFLHLMGEPSADEVQDEEWCFMVEDAFHCRP